MNTSPTGIAIGAGTDVAIESAGIVLASDDPRGVVAVATLSKASYRMMQQNLWWAAGYNLFAIPLAAGVLARAGLVLPMAVRAMSTPSSYAASTYVPPPSNPIAYSELEPFSTLGRAYGCGNIRTRRRRGYQWAGASAEEAAVDVVPE